VYADGQNAVLYGSVRLLRVFQKTTLTAISLDFVCPAPNGGFPYSGPPFAFAERRAL